MDKNALEIFGYSMIVPGIPIVAFIISAVRATKRNNAQPVRTVRVQVVTKNNEGIFADNRQQVVDFQAEDGELIKISVTDDYAYVQMDKGMDGMLTFRGWTYINFVPTDPSVEFFHPDAKITGSGRRKKRTEK